METRPNRRTVLTSLVMTGASAWVAPVMAQHSIGKHPAAESKEIAEAAAAIVAYFDRTASLLFRPAQGIFKHPSIAPSLPGKAYNAQLWDWDTYWTVRGLFAYARIKKDDTFRQKVAEHAKGSLLEFLDNQSAEGRIPAMMSSTDPDVFGSLDPTHNQSKPVMAQLALLICRETDDATWIAPVFDKLLAFHESWLRMNKSQIGLLVWSNGIGLGNDNDPTSSGRPPMSSVNPLLNCMFFEDLRAAADLAGRLNKAEQQRKLVSKADQFGALIQNILWDPRDCFFYSHDVLCSDDRVTYIPNQPRGMDVTYKSLPMRIATFTGFLPLWCGLATPPQADSLLDAAWRQDDRFRAHFGCRSLSAHETMYSLLFSSNPSNWLGPVWVIVNFLVWRALKNYGTAEESRDLARATIRLLANDLAVHGTLNEYYHPDTGEALSHPGFMDWNLLVLEMIEDLRMSSST